MSLFVRCASFGVPASGGDYRAVSYTHLYWEADTKTPVLEVDFGKELTFNRLLLQEFIEKGQRDVYKRQI